MDASARRHLTCVRPDNLIRVGWLVFASLLVTLALAGVGPYSRLVIESCDREPCLSAQFNASEHRAIRELTVAFAAPDPLVPTVSMGLVAVAALLIAGFGIRRRPTEPAVFSLAILLTTFATGELILALAFEQPSFALLAEGVRMVHLAVLAPCLVLMPGKPLPARWIGVGAVLTVLLAIPVVANPGTLVFAILFSVVVAMLAVANVGLRYRHQRDEQIVWLAAGLVLLACVQVLGEPLRMLPLPRFSLSSSMLVFWRSIVIAGMILQVGAIVCLAVALLRKELIEVETALNRTLVYGLLTVIVIGTYVGIVGYLSLVFQNRANLWLSLVATGVIALLFQRLRDQVQHLVNQLLYGRRDEPYAVMSSLGRRLETSLPPDAVLSSIVQAVAHDLKLPYVAIALSLPDGSSDIRASAGILPADTAAFALSYQGEPVGELIVALRTGETQLGGADQRLLEDLARQVGIAARAAQLTESLQRSRQQLVTTREEERRRLRRDLHDGLGPALATITIQSDTAHDLVKSNPEAAQAVLRDLTRQSQTTLEDVRRLIHQLRPPVLDDLGLAAALQSLAASCARSGVSITLKASDDIPDLPAAIEAAIYRITQEALTNMIRHAEAANCQVHLCVRHGLCLMICDDGVGIPSSRVSGVGLLSMRERAEELGGSCHVGPGEQGGTTVRVQLPLPGSAENGADPPVDR